MQMAVINNLFFQGWLSSQPAGEATILRELYHKIFDDVYKYVSLNLGAKMELLECNYVRQVGFYFLSDL